MIFVFVLVFELVIFVALTIAMLILLRSVINGAVYYPSEKKNVETIVELLKIKPGEKIADLGSGDGRIVIALAKAGAEAHGYEINPLLVYESRKKIKREGLNGLAFIHYQSFWQADLSQFNAIAIYGLPNFFKKLGIKMRKEMKPGARVVSNMFEFPGWTAAQKTKEGVYLYKIQ